jgi:spermidine/putrescine transport system permease protein
MSGRIRALLAPYLLLLPGGLWLVIFFVIPMLVMLSMSLMTGDITNGFSLTWHWQNYQDGWNQYHTQIIRSFWYGGLSTVAQLLIGYPVAYWIAFKGGTRKSFYLFLLLLPFFVSFVLRTASWNFFLSDNGLVLGPLKSWHLIPQDAHVIGTSFAVVAGLTYNYLPFMVLPLYVALERVDHRVVEAAHDLYAGRLETFRRVVFPLSLPGVFAGVLISFVPAASDFVNADVLGGPQQTMIGNVIQTQYLNFQNYPVASALSFMLMAIMLIGIFSYAKALGTEDVLEAAAV